MSKVEAGPLDDHDVCQFKQLVPAVPRSKSCKSICSHEQAQRPFSAHLSADCIQGIHCIAGALAQNFPLVQNEAWIAGNRKLEHLHALLSRGMWLAAVRRDVCRDKSHLCKIKTVGGLPSKRKMAVMHRIKHAAKNADGF